MQVTASFIFSPMIYPSSNCSSPSPSRRMDPPSQVNRRKQCPLSMEQVKRLMHHNPMMMMMPAPTNGQADIHHDPALNESSQGVI